jgi:hypothetical protein
VRAVHAVHFPDLLLFEIAEKSKNSIILKYPNGFPSQIQGNFPSPLLQVEARHEN